MAKTFRGNEYLGIRIPTVFAESDARRCAGCGLHIDGRPFRVSIMDIVSSERPVWADQTPTLNPGPHQFHDDPACVRAWMRERGYLLCRHSAVREIMRPVAIPGDPSHWGLCDGLHHDAHEFVPA
ncbi:MAG: hypothetical protein ACP5VP_09260 [Candidatus Limnocylindrales bacterium]